jgi:signal transduction histidine kinase
MCYNNQLMDWNTLLVALTSLASFLLALFVFIKGPQRQVNQTMALFSLSVAVWTFGQALGGVVEAKSSVLFWTRLNVGAAVLLPAFYFHFILVLIGRQSKLLWATYAAASLLLLLLPTAWFIRDVAPVASHRYYPQAGIVYPFFAAYLGLTFLYAFWLLARQYRQSSGERRNQLLYVVLASLIGFSGGITAFLPVWGVDFPQLSNYALPIYVLIAVYAIIKHRLLDISVVLRAGLIYSVLTLIFAGFFALAILLTNYLFLSVGHFNPLWTTLLVVFVSVVVFQPLRNRVQAAVDRLFFRGEYRYRRALDQLSAENQRLFRTLLQADKLAALGTLAAGMAHEIKNPLASIKGMTQVLTENLHDGGFIHDYMELVPRQLERINRIVENLLQAGRARPAEKKEMDVNHLIGEIMDLNRPLCVRQEIEVDLNLPPLPLLWGDPEQLHQVLNNLILNAIQALPKGGRLSIQSQLTSQNQICVEIKDNGLGIPSDKIDYIFDPFFSLKEAGSGLGLFVAYRIIQEHGGSIEVESAPERGTKFKVCLPIRPKRSA